MIFEENEPNSMSDDEVQQEVEEEISFSELNFIRNSIENMTKFNQIEVLRLLHGNKTIILNENKYGIHVNLSELNREILNTLRNFIFYVTTQETDLSAIEKQKEQFKNIYFSKDNKDMVRKNNNKTSSSLDVTLTTQSEF